LEISEKFGKSDGESGEIENWSFVVSLLWFHREVAVKGLLEICTPDIRISTSAGYQWYNKGISRENLPNSNYKYLMDFSRILKSICWIYLNINQISMDREQKT